MKNLLIAVAAAMAVATMAPAQNAIDATEGQDMPFETREATETVLEDLKWVARALVVFADSPLNPLFREQMALLAEREQSLIDRDVVVIVDTDPEAESDIRRKLRPRGFSIVLIGKDGGVKLRKPFPWNVRELSRNIDKMPLRQQEIRDANKPGG